MTQSEPTTRAAPKGRRLPSGQLEGQPDSGQDPPVFLFFGNHWFAENRTSSHHMARELARHFEVHYFECPGLRAPSGSGRDLTKIIVKLWNFLRGARKVPEGLKVRTLLQLPFHRFGLVRWLNRLLVKGTVRWMMWHEGVRAPITWFHIPHVPYLVGALGERTAVYYCIDDYAAFPGVDEKAVRAMDDETTRRAHFVFIASDTLSEHKRSLNEQTYVNPHGVDVEHFRRAQDEGLAIPPDVADLPKPIVGYFGLIERFTDLDLIDYLAQRRPNWSFVMIGRVAIPESELPKRPNIYFLGKRPYEELPAYGKAFDVAVIPFRTGAWSHHANPLKLREYLAMGKPVVAVETPEILKFADVVAVTRTPEGFLAGLDEAVGQPALSRDAEQRMGKVAASSWRDRVGDVLRIICANRSGQ